MRSSSYKSALALGISSVLVSSLATAQTAAPQPAAAPPNTTPTPPLAPNVQPTQPGVRTPPSSAAGAAKSGALAPQPAPGSAASTTALGQRGVGTAQQHAGGAESLLTTSTGGLTAEMVGKRAVQTSFSAKSSEEALRGAAARVDQTIAQFLPRLNAIAKYTRLSDFTPPPLFAGPSVNFLATTQQRGEPFDPNRVIPVNFGDSASFPVLVNNYLLQAQIVVPISDYVLRLHDAYKGSQFAEEALKYDVVAAKTKSYAEGKVAYYTWLRAQGAVVVTQQAIDDQKQHLKDANNALNVGNASKADVLRAETGVASAQLALERAKNLAELAEKQVRVAMHATDEEKLAPGETLDTQLEGVSGALSQMESEAMSGRPEMKSLSTALEALQHQRSAAKAGYYPVVTGVGNATYANPNPRRVPQAQEWFPTWDVSAQLTWSPNDIFITGPNVTAADVQIAQLASSEGQLKDSLRLEVTQAFQAIREADAAIDTAKRELDSAKEAVRVARELFNAGRATSTTLTDAETDLTRARLDLLNGLVDARIARVRLDHAVGRDAARTR